MRDPAAVPAPHPGVWRLWLAPMRSPGANARKYRDYPGDHKNRKYAAVSRGFVADEPVTREPVSAVDFPINRENTGNILENRPGTSSHVAAFSRKIRSLGT